MSTIDVIRAWKDPEYRNSLSADQRALLPDHPAGLIELDDSELDQVAGAAKPRSPWPCTGEPCRPKSWGCL